MHKRVRVFENMLMYMCMSISIYCSQCIFYAFLNKSQNFCYYKLLEFLFLPSPAQAEVAPCGNIPIPLTYIHIIHNSVTIFILKVFSKCQQKMVDRAAVVRPCCCCSRYTLVWVIKVVNVARSEECAGCMPEEMFDCVS